MYSNPRAENLQARLVQEWTLPQTGAVEPVIIEENAQFYQDLKHLYVVWSEWEGLNQRERSRIIMGAYEQIHASGAASVTVAMGLTPKEAARLGVEYAPIEAAA
jgi:hypothetical protein